MSNIYRNRNSHDYVKVTHTHVVLADFSPIASAWSSCFLTLDAQLDSRIGGGASVLGAFARFVVVPFAVDAAVSVPWSGCFLDR